MRIGGRTYTSAPAFAGALVSYVLPNQPVTGRCVVVAVGTGAVGPVVGDSVEVGDCVGPVGLCVGPVVCVGVGLVGLVPGFAAQVAEATVSVSAFPAAPCTVTMTPVYVVLPSEFFVT